MLRARDPATRIAGRLDLTGRSSYNRPPSAGSCRPTLPVLLPAAAGSACREPIADWNLEEERDAASTVWA